MNFLRIVDNVAKAVTDLTTGNTTKAVSHMAIAATGTIPIISSLPVSKLIDSAITGEHHHFTVSDRNGLDVNHDGAVNFDDVSSVLNQVNGLDVNHDGVVNLDDVSSVLNQVNGLDVNHDGVVNLDDVSSVLNQVLDIAHASGHIAHGATIGHVAVAGSCPQVALIGVAISGSIYGGKKLIENDMDIEKTCQSIGKDIENVGETIDKAVINIEEGLSGAWNQMFG